MVVSARMAAQLARFKDLWDLRVEGVDALRERLIVPRELLLANLPWKRSKERFVVRRAPISPSTTLEIVYTSTTPGVDIPFGADRALLAYLSTLGARDGHVSFDSLTGFFKAFEVEPSGQQYRIFMERIARITGLSIAVRVLGASQEARVNVRILSRVFTPNDMKFARRVLEVEGRPLPVAIPQAYSRWGFELSPEYLEMLRDHPVPMPLALMRIFRAAPMAWDFTAWVLYRCHCARSIGRPIPLSRLREQLGTTEAVDRKLKSDLAGVLRQIKVVLPGFPAEFNRKHELQIAPFRIASIDGPELVVARSA